ncbi:hypothetical protein F4860DRAFT_470531 [Xylaria cubensis]|nr:hypothetical protein F4860DRAFT_470531 [Xylaria cubensis]
MWRISWQVSGISAFQLLFVIEAGARSWTSCLLILEFRAPADVELSRSGLGLEVGIWWYTCIPPLHSTHMLCAQTSICLRDDASGLR